MQDARCSSPVGENTKRWPIRLTCRCGLKPNETKWPRGLHTSSRSAFARILISHGLVVGLVRRVRQVFQVVQPGGGQ